MQTHGKWICLWYCCCGAVTLCEDFALMRASIFYYFFLYRTMQKNIQRGAVKAWLAPFWLWTSHENTLLGTSRETATRTKTSSQYRAMLWLAYESGLTGATSPARCSNHTSKWGWGLAYVKWSKFECWCSEQSTDVGWRRQLYMQISKKAKF